MRNKGKALHCQMSLALKELKEHFPQFVHTIFLHGFLPPGYCLFLLFLNFLPQTSPANANAQRIAALITVSINVARNADINASFSGCLIHSDACAFYFMLEWHTNIVYIIIGNLKIFKRKCKKESYFAGNGVSSYVM